MVTNSLPHWLSAEDVEDPLSSKRHMKVMRINYKHIFERVIEDIYRGKSLRALIEGDYRDISYEDFMRWVKVNPERRRRFEEAQEMRTEFLAAEILSIADGADVVEGSPDNVNRDKLRIETRKWVMGAHNRKKYGETKQIELGGTISIRDALAQAQARVLSAEVLEDDVPMIGVDEEQEDEEQEDEDEGDD